MKFKESKYLLAALLMATSVGASAYSQNQESKSESKQEEAKPAEEYKTGHIKFAINIPIGSFEKDYKKIESFKDKM